ncbi:MAG: PAS domain S-box protein [Halioglobus sp.]
MAENLRKKAEHLLNQDPMETPVLSTVEVQKILHELNVHQIELQMQTDELRQAQQELCVTRDTYVELYDFAPVGYLTLDPEGRIIEANFTVATLLGLERGKLLVGRTFSSFVHRDSLNTWHTHRRHMAENSERHGIDLALERPDKTGLTVRVECTPRPSSGQYLMALTDISQRVHAEEALKKSEKDLSLFNLQLEQLVDERSVALSESEEKYRLLFESERDAIMIVDGDTQRFVDVNRAAADVYGYSREEFLELTHGELAADPDGSDVVIRQTLAGSQPSAIISRHRKKDGTIFPVEITRSSFSIQGRRLVCRVVRDITERVRWEAELEHNQDELRKLASELSLAEQRERERIGRELHDGVSQLLSSSILRLTVLKDIGLPKAATESINMVCGIVEQTLNQTRSLTFELSCPMLNELGLAAALDELCSSMSHEYSIRFEFKGRMELLPIPMDRKIALYRSTRELLINVMKHSEAKWACVHIERMDDCVRISVEDDGRGFNAEMAGKGFSPTGGFGLFNIGETLRHAGGNLQIESIPGDGTEVVLSVPLEAPHA